MLAQINFSEDQLSPRRNLDRKILVAVEHILLAQAFEKILRARFHNVRLAKPNDARAAIATYSPDIAILEISLAQLHDLSKEVANLQRATKLVYLTTDISAQTAAAAFRLGASAYVTMQAGMDDLQLALRKVSGKGRYLSALIPKMNVDILLRNRLNNRWIEPLTSRQLEVLELFAQGKTMKEIANSLNVSIGTVAFHKYGIMEKLSMTNNAEFIKYGLMRCMHIA